MCWIFIFCWIRQDGTKFVWHLWLFNTSSASRCEICTMRSEIRQLCILWMMRHLWHSSYSWCFCFPDRTMSGFVHLKFPTFWWDICRQASSTKALLDPQKKSWTSISHWLSEPNPPLAFQVFPISFCGLDHAAPLAD